MSEIITFKDFYENDVMLSFSIDPFSKEPKHVWVICRYQDKWLLTEHPRRGLEFPGGKVEDNETPQAAAVREIYEETGAEESTLTYIGQYKVEGRSEVIVKNIYFASVEKLIQKNHYFETNGPVLLHTLPNNLKQDPRFSFIMKDDVLVYSMEHIKKFEK